MARPHRAANNTTAKWQDQPPTFTTAVGASYTFDPRADGLAGIYAMRVLERGIDPRALSADVRADRLGPVARGPAVSPHATVGERERFGRGTAGHQRAVAKSQPVSPNRSAKASAKPMAIVLASLKGRPRPRHWPRRLAAAGLAAILLLPIGVAVAGAQESTLQSRYIVQEGDTLEGVAAEFGVDPAAILAASALQSPPYLTPHEIIVIPAPGEEPNLAAANAAQQEGASPFVVAAHDVAPGDTLAKIAASYSVDPLTLAAFNGVFDADSLALGQRLRIPLTDNVTSPDQAAVEPLSRLDEWVPDGVGGASPTSEEPAGEPVFAAGVPAHLQAYSLSCEYASAFIATSAFGWGVPESAFVERIGNSSNPHWGYRGNISGTWGGTDDYGIYPEALVPTLNEFGFAGDVFYSGGDAAALTARLDAGEPVLTWLGYFGDTAWLQEDEGAYLLAPGMHVVVAYGYDEGGVYVSNPGRGSYGYYPWADFLAMWQVLDGMALGVAPL